MVDRKHSFSEELERRARSVVAAAIEETEQSSVIRGLMREIAFVLDQIDTLRNTYDRLGQSLLQVECYTDTELMQMEARMPRYSPYRFPEREKLQRRLGDIEKERRRLAIGKEEALQRLHARLLVLLNRRDQLEIH